MPNRPQAQLIAHAARCKRPAPVLRLSWRQQPELWCPACGRAALVPASGGVVGGGETAGPRSIPPPEYVVQTPQTNH